MKKILLLLGIVVIAVILMVIISRFMFEKKIDGEINVLSQKGSEARSKIFHYSDLEGLPQPVQKYFKHVLTDGQEYIKFARLKQTGQFRMKEDQPWTPIKAEQYFLTQEPAFLWKATFSMAPLLWIDGRDMYYQGKGNMLIKVLSTVTVANAIGKEMDVSTLIRFLAEAPWLPTALLPGDYIEWQELDTNSARAIIKDKGCAASGVFTFNEEGEIIKFVSNDRYMESEGKYLKEKWTGYFGKYREIDGMKIPTEGEVEWNLPDKDLPYAKLKITEIQYNIPKKY